MGLAVAANLFRHRLIFYPLTSDGQDLGIGDPIGNALANHDGRQVGVGANAIRHD
jgi:hypothetical protein